jgi:hypothetical protein
VTAARRHLSVVPAADSPRAAGPHPHDVGPAVDVDDAPDPTPGPSSGAGRRARAKRSRARLSLPPVRLWVAPDPGDDPNAA